MSELQSEDAAHRKRLSQILRFVASWHQAFNAGDASHSFVRDVEGTDFYQDESNVEMEEDDFQSDVLFTTKNFRKLLELQSQNLFDSPPFSFYAANTDHDTNDNNNGKRAFSGTLKRLSSTKNPNNGVYWLRLVRLTKRVVEPPKAMHPSIQAFLDDWVRRTPRARHYKQLLSSPKQIDQVLASNPNRHVKHYLKSYKKYVLIKLYQETLEPMYNQLFEWIQQKYQHSQELVWSLGHAKFKRNNVFVNGPLLDVLVEVELAPDGALLVKPRKHTGVTLNRQVVAAIGAQPDVLAKWHRVVSELIPTEISPGQPSTYLHILKKMALELCPGGRFQRSTSHVTPSTKHLVVSEAWCMYTRSKPSSVWARDANLLADKLAKEDDLRLPMATWSLTHGPNALEDKINPESQKATSKQSSIWKFVQNISFLTSQSREEAIIPRRPLFPLETSDSQNRIAHLLLNKDYPAVVTEGPPGTGKTHTIANLVCAYLCQGKRVLVTSKNAPALSVLRNRLPRSVQELVVDVSQSESSGMRQLQQTVERLANRVAVASVDIETQKTKLLQQSIDDLEQQMEEIDRAFCTQSERIRLLLQRPEGVKLTEIASALIEKAPWILQDTVTLKDLQELLDRLKRLEIHEPNIRNVENYHHPPSAELHSMVMAKAKASITSSIADASRSWVSAVPILGSMTGMDVQRKDLQKEMDRITLNGNPPITNADWFVVAKAMQRSQFVASFEADVWNLKVASQQWPKFNFSEEQTISEVMHFVESGIELKQLSLALNTEEELKDIIACRMLDSQRRKLAKQIRHHAEELVDATVISELSRSFTPDAQSALITFSQIAGAAKFARSSKPSKMTQRQRRRRQEYLDAFERCCRFIPCWIMTTGQISDYLPPEGLFDLVVIDEASQSDVTVLPGMLRGRQWLIVGDGKQVSPTEAFVSEDAINSLRAALPQCPLERSLMPGHSFFDLCAQAFPRGRVVLSEHFRCAPDIIEFSNRHFYDDRLVPLRLPTKSERFTPSVVDIRVNGIKDGKINEVEANTIVEMVQEIMNLPDNEVNPRSIGVISLIGDEQSRLIRGRLLDAVGPEKMAHHNVLVGDPPLFQGAEREVVFLSMVCSRGRVPTQSQLTHFQRANVAMSRAKDRCVLVRSIDLTDIPSMEDVKVSMIEFFMNSANSQTESISFNRETTGVRKIRNGTILLKKVLSERGFLVSDMGIVWKNGICVEHTKSESRVALIVDCDEISSAEWKAGYVQQKAIERVGWTCFRIDLLSLFVNFESVINSAISFLKSVGIEPQEDNQKEDDEGVTIDITKDILYEDEDSAGRDSPIILEEDEQDQDVFTVSSDESMEDSKPAAALTKPSIDSYKEDEIDASRFGEVVDLDFLESNDDGSSSDNIIDIDDEHESHNRPNNFKTTGLEEKDNPSEDSAVPSQVNVDPNENLSGRARRHEDSDSSYDDLTAFSSLSKKRRYKYRKLDRYSRDGRWYPKKKAGDADDVELMYDTDSDLSNDRLR